MKTHFILLFLFLSLSFTPTHSVEIEADYDEYLDMISIDGKLFIAIEPNEPSSLETPRNLHEGEELKVECECSEEYVKGMTLVFFIFMVVCKYITSYINIIYSLNNICRFNVRFNCRISFSG
jgi:hypothetical protein